MKEYLDHLGRISISGGVLVRIIEKYSDGSKELSLKTLKEWSVKKIPKWMFEGFLEES